MNNRQRFYAAMHYQPVDRPIIADFGFWDETMVVWKKQSMPRWVNKTNVTTYLGMDFTFRKTSTPTKINPGLCPAFPRRVLEDRGDEEIFQQADGVRVLRQKFMRSIPNPVQHLLSDRDSWRKHYLPRLDPDAPQRFPADWQARVERLKDPARPEPVFLPAGSLYGWLRNWMGVENLSLVVYHDPAWFEEMVTAAADCILGTLERALASGVQFDGAAMWEDMCYNAGPLLSPKHFKQYLVPHYRRIADLLHSHGVDVIWVDCDGKIDALVPLWLEAGVNCMFPVEIGTWGADPYRFRAQYGKDLLMLGAVDKRILAGPLEGIEREVQRLLPLVDSGGFVGFADHLVPPDVPYSHYLHYLKCVRRTWGRGLDLKPAGWER